MADWKQLKKMLGSTVHKPADYAGFERGSRARAAGFFRASEFKDRPAEFGDVPAIGSHHFIPTDLSLAKKLGLKKGERIHFFAAFSGEWAKALAEQGLNVHATDASGRIVSAIMANPGRIASVEQRTAGYGAIMPGKFDWSVSFEPFPALDSPRATEDVARESLINNKGLMIMYHSSGGMLLRHHERRLRLMARIYKARVEKRVVDVEGITKTLNEGKIEVITLISNPEAARMAQLDLKVERRKYLQRGTRAQLIKNLAIEFSLRRHQIRESLKRIQLAEKYGLATLG